MQNFQFYVPTKVVFGQGTVDQVGQLVAEQGCKKVLVHFGGHSAKASGLLDRVCASLQSAGVPYVTLGGVKPNPRLSLVYEGLEFDMDALRELGCEYLFSGAEIGDAERMGLELVGYYETDDSYWGIWVYEL